MKPMGTKLEESRISEMSSDPDNTNPQPSVMERVEEVEANLAASFPSCTKTMVRSNVRHGFWLHLPMPFCKLHMPKHDTTVILEDESGEEYKTTYIAERTALSAGWKAFSAGHKLVEGDVLVFHLVSSSKFKVCIVRAFKSNKVDGGFGLLNVNLHAKPIRSIRTKRRKRISKRAKCLELLPHDNVENNSLMVLDTNNEHLVGQYDNDNKDPSFGLSDGIRSLASIIDFEERKSIESFIIIVNGSRIDSELSEYHRTKYYELCCSQNSFLHDHLLKSISSKLAAEIITQTISIAEAIKACKLSTSQADYMLWDKTLKGFELLGMNVGFLRARLNRLMTLALELQEAVESERYKASLEKDQMKEEKKSLELKLVKLKEAMHRLDAEIETLKENAEKHQLKFQEEVNAAW
ncbi:B3 domain-containing protein Os01g0234100-like [Durio zibethinus]|uniref:B3 domain-containing protein Os01g0234100-like n=1 Tax=Durio zibethinus TaxID=66656 RepID=A0A6P6ABV6_DURZI|nr:B3 domain-containing protein Os01g0234100-like [Durio zibethinus]XP_022762333.1 B3 domain-containing protein Os01g0234100-like [Durio zibethinus]